MIDPIERQAAIDAIEGLLTTGQALECQRRIYALPSAQPEKTQLSREDATFDCISRQAAIDAMQKAVKNIDSMNKADIVAVISNLPSVQPEIVRCKDCKHQVKEWREDERFKDNGYWVHGCEIISDVCGYWALFGHNDQFCSEAERRNDG